MSKLKDFEDNLKFLVVTAKKPLVWLDTFDYNYVKDVLNEFVCNEKGVSYLMWTNAAMHVTDSNDTKLSKNKIPLGLLIPQYSSGILKTPNDNIEQNVISDMKLLVAIVSESMFLEDGNRNEEHLVARLQEFVFKNNRESDRKEKKTILIVSSYHFDVNGLEHICERLEVPLPDKEDIRRKLCIDSLDSLNSEMKHEFEFSASFKMNVQENSDSLVDALHGMYLFDIKNLLKTIMSESKYGKISPFDYNYGNLTDRVTEGKKQIVKNSNLLEVIDIKDKNYHEHVADIDNLRKHLENEKKLITNSYFLQSNLPRPKGILLVGAPGCGKSESAKATASILELPLFRLNIGDLMGHKYGQSENRFNEALRTADASAPCVLWIDEIEKAFAGAGSEQNNDDTLTHIIGRFLTWMQEHETLVYLVATANNLSQMRPELLRKGRWDEIYFLTYPSLKGRVEILRKCLQRYKIRLVDENDYDILKYSNFQKLSYANKEDLVKLFRLMKDWSGAQISSMVVEAAKEVFRSKADSSIVSLQIHNLYKKYSKDEIGGTAEEREDTIENAAMHKALNDRINNEIIQLQLRSMRKFEKTQRTLMEELLREKYEAENREAKQQYSYMRYQQDGYKPASNTVFQAEDDLSTEDILKLIYEQECGN